jgi:hypothetical protein
MFTQLRCMPNWLDTAAGSIPIAVEHDCCDAFAKPGDTAAENTDETHPTSQPQSLQAGSATRHTKSHPGNLAQSSSWLLVFFVVIPCLKRHVGCAIAGRVCGVSTVLARQFQMLSTPTRFLATPRKLGYQIAAI